jgi:hypothetical protein
VALTGRSVSIERVEPGESGLLVASCQAGSGVAHWCTGGACLPTDRAHWSGSPSVQ